MRIIIVNDNDNECGICGACEKWIEKMEIEHVHFLYCHKCNTITFLCDIDENKKERIENQMNIYSHKVKV